jgi:hypothetical protein
MRFIALFLIAFAFAKNESEVVVQPEVRVGHRTRVTPADRLKKYDGKVLIGREIELTERPLSTILDYFDLRSIKPESYSEEHLKNYLWDSDAFYALPRNYRDQLSAGLDLQPITVFSPEEKVPSSGLLGPNGKPINAGPREIEKPKGLILPKTIEVPKSAQIRPDNRLKSYNWTELNSRWNALPLDEKQAIFDPKYLGRLHKAGALIRALHTFELGNVVRLTEEGEQELGKYFKNGFEFHRDTDAIEFKDAKPYESVSDFYQDVHGFSRRVGSNYLIDPSQRQNWDSSLHFHISRPDLPIDQNFERLAKEFKKLLIVQGLEKGEADLLNGTHDVGYSYNIRFKSAVRLVNPNRIEFRLHEGKLDEELDYFLKHMTSTDLEKAAREVSRDFEKRITPKVLRYMFGYLSGRNIQDLLGKTKFERLAYGSTNSGHKGVKDHLSIVERLAKEAGLNPEAVFNSNSFRTGVLLAPNALSSANMDSTISHLIHLGLDSSKGFGNHTSPFIEKHKAKLETNPLVASRFLTELKSLRARVAQARVPKEVQKAKDLQSRLVNLISEVGPRDEKLTLELIELFSDPFVSNEDLFFAVKKMGVNRPQVIKRLLEIGTTDDIRTTGLVVRALQSVKPATPEIHEYFLKKITSHDAWIKIQSLNTLVEANAPFSKQIAQTIEWAWSFDDSRYSAIQAIRKYLVKDEAWIKRLVEYIHLKPASSINRDIIATLAESGLESVHLDLVRDLKNSHLGLHVRDVLSKTDIQSEKVLQNLLDLAFEKERSIANGWAMEILGRQNPNSMIIHQEVMKNFNSSEVWRNKIALKLVSYREKIDESVALELAEILKKGSSGSRLGLFNAASDLLRVYKPQSDLVISKLKSADNLRELDMAEIKEVIGKIQERVAKGVTSQSCQDRLRSLLNSNVHPVEY